jgi:DNA/RNA endonuclease G (NUC1)
MLFGTGRIGQRFARGFVAAALISLSFLLGVASAHATIGVAYQMLLGNPSNAVADTNNHNHYLIQRSVEAFDYNDNHRQPNWASWHLTTDDTGSSGRSGSFFVDTNLPPNFTRVQTSDYSGSGYDRGHMCPSGDRTVSAAVNEETFLMSNMIPQSPDNNQGVWANLESYCRTLASAGNEVLITCGPEGFGSARTASAGQIPIASNVWKIIIVVPLGGGGTLDRITDSTRVIAVNIPNIQGIRSDPWQNYLTSVNRLQTNTGFTFFTALNSNVAAVLRAKVDGAPAAGITGFTPGVGAANTSVIITGTNFNGATAVKFNGQYSTFTLNSATQITASVPSGTTTGPISVLAAGGLATSANTFTVNSPVVTPPTLIIAPVGSDLVISWPSAATGYGLQQNPDLNPANWTGYTGTVNPIGTNNTVTITAPAGKLFFRLAAP